MAKIAWDEAAGAEQNARMRLPAMLAEYFAEGRRLAGGNPPAAELHAFRLATKRVRYTLEMFRPVYGRGLEERLESLRNLQTMLGEINDCAAGRARLDAALDAAPDERDRVDRFIDDRQAALTAAFLEFWRQTFDAAGCEERWQAHLRQGPRARTAPVTAKKAAKPKKAVKKTVTTRRRAPAQPS